jgi:hypothetical protein
MMVDMRDHLSAEAASSRPRVAVLGAERGSLGLAGGLDEALRRAVDVVEIDATSPMRGGFAAYRAIRRAVLRESCELLHLADARFAPIGAVAARLGVPVTVSVTSLDVAAWSPWAAIARRALNGLDQGFVTEDAVGAYLRERAPRLPLARVRAGAPALPAPSMRAQRSVIRALRGLDPLAPVIGMPWPAETDDLRWFRDSVLPRLAEGATCLMFGAPPRRQAERVIGGRRRRRERFRVLSGRLSVDVVAAVAQRADLLAVAKHQGASGGDDDALLLALAASGAPLIASGLDGSAALRHERNAIIAPACDTLALVDAVNGALALPAIQRQYLGADFARYTLDAWRWDDAAATYAARFAVLVGRPQIPAELLAA